MKPHSIATPKHREGGSLRSRPILFSAAMVRALLEGRKTQTRRIFKLPKWAHPHDKGDDIAGETPQICHRDSGCLVDVSCPYGQPGDQLWVRETFYCDHGDYPTAPIAQMKQALDYRASHDCANWEAGCPCCDENGRSCWRPSIHMPRWASRLTLTIKSTRVERLQDISEADAKAEGVEASKTVEMKDGSPCYTLPYQKLWCQLNGVDSWNKSPRIWVIEFQKVEQEQAEKAEKKSPTNHPSATSAPSCKKIIVQHSRNLGKTSPPQSPIANRQS